MPQSEDRAREVDAAFESWVMERPNHGRRWRRADWEAGFLAGRASAEAEIERLRAALTEIDNMCPATQEVTRLHQACAIASTALNPEPDQ